VLQTNLDSLMEHYIGGVHDKLFGFSAATQASVDAVHPPAGSLLEQMRTLKSRFYGNFAEIKSMIAGGLRPHGYEMATQALDAFNTRWSRGDVGHLANHSGTLDAFSSHMAQLMRTIRSASANPLSAPGEVAQRVTSTLHWIGKNVQSDHQMLGVYRTSALDKKKQQEKLSRVGGSTVDLGAEIQQEGTNALMVAFDRSWWTIREKLDAYFDAAENQVAALGKAIETMEDYTLKCTKDIHQLRLAQSQASRADNAALSQLHNTWLVIEQEVGLLASRMADGHAFLRLARSDVFATDLDAKNRSVICSGGEAAVAAARTALEKSFEEGLARQTWVQLLGIFSDVQTLRGRFLAANLPQPKMDTLAQAKERAAAALQELQDQRDDIAVELTAFICRPKTKLETAMYLETNVEAMTEKLRKVSQREGELEKKLAALKDLVAKVR